MKCVESVELQSRNQKKNTRKIEEKKPAWASLNQTAIRGEQGIQLARLPLEEN